MVTLMVTQAVQGDQKLVNLLRFALSPSDPCSHRRSFPMTIALCLKVSDGLVFGADSAATVFTSSGERVYTNAEKIVNLHKALPVAMATYGLGGIGDRSTISLAKDLRGFFTEVTEDREDFHLDEATYTVEEIANHVRRFFYDELYCEYVIPAVEEAREESDDDVEISFPVIGFIVGGISANRAKSEVWTIQVGPDGECNGPNLEWDRDTDGVVVYRGMTEPLDRLLAGFSQATFNEFLAEGLSRDEAASLLVRWAPLAHGAMPIQDAIELVEYLASVVAGYLRFSSGPDVVAPPIDVAAITTHEKFKWVQRKHFYPPELNP